MKVLDRDPCSYCGEPTQHIDHIHPVRDGGLSEWDNLTAACGKCNRRKAAKSLLRFMLFEALVQTDH